MDDVLFISSVLYTEGTDNINQKIVKDAKILDPPDEVAERLIKESISEEFVYSSGNE